MITVIMLVKEFVDFPKSQTESEAAVTFLITLLLLVREC